MDNNTSVQHRPLFLTIICIISFVGLGISLVNSISALTLSTVGAPFYKMAEEEVAFGIEQARMDNPASVAFVESMLNAVMKAIERLPLLAALFLLCSIVALAGVFMMWNLKKTGFYLFTAAKVIQIIIPSLVIGYNLFALLMSIPLFMTATLFITLYALNFNSMK